MKKRRLKKIERDYQAKQLRAKSTEACRHGRVPVDKSKLNMGNSHASPPDYYVDRPFVCADCGVEEVWLAEQQKWWYEEVGGFFFSTAVRCRACRKIEKQGKEDARRTQRD